MEWVGVEATTSATIFLMIRFLSK